MANPEQLAILEQQGVEEWNRWREAHPNEVPDLREAVLNRTRLWTRNFAQMGDISNLTISRIWRANLREANFQGVNLSWADLSDAKLEWADLRNTNCSLTTFRMADLSNANFCEARLHMTNLYDADLTGTDFSGANLAFANFSRAHLTDANFERARAGGAVFADVDLSAARGLETVEHHGPSTVGIDTIYKSKGKIPEVFLRGCGVTDEFIELARSIGEDRVRYFSCFISYSTKDQAFAERLYADLQAKGVRCWFAPHEIKGGREINEQIDEAIREHDKLLLILSEHSMESEWVKTELGKALRREKDEGKRVLYPVGLISFETMQRWEYVDSSGKNLAEKLRAYFIPDFSNWKDHDSYQAALGRLVGDLKAAP